MREVAPCIGESIVVNHDVVLTVVEIADDEVILSVDAPEWMRVEARQEDPRPSLAPR